jgi:hypothetical protein
LILINEILTAQKKCPACDEEFEIDTKFCKFCGVNMETYDSQTIEISQTMRLRRFGYISFIIIFTGIIFYICGVVMLNLPNEWESKMALTIMVGIIIPVMGIFDTGFLIWILWIYRRAKFRRVVSISPKGIKIILPKEPIFEVYWPAFDLIHLWRSSSSRSNTHAYKFYFISNGHIYDDITIKGARHFGGLNCRAIVTQLKQYAAKMNVEFTRGKRIKN